LAWPGVAEHQRWRDVADLPAAAELVASPYDAQARFASKRFTAWVGYKAHLTEECDPDRPHLLTHVETTPLTHVETTPATEDDAVALPRVHAGLAERGLLPHEHLVDTRYMSAAGILKGRARPQGTHGLSRCRRTRVGRAGPGKVSMSTRLPSTGRPGTRPARKARSAPVGGPGWTIMARRWCVSVFVTATAGPVRCVPGAPAAPAALGRWTCARSPSTRCCNRRAVSRPRPSGSGKYDRRAGIEGSISDGVRDVVTAKSKNRRTG
jgi:hypothetical protein